MAGGLIQTKLSVPRVRQRIVQRPRLLEKLDTAAFLVDVMGLSLSRDEISALEARTEGWITGLQLATLSLRGRKDPGGLVESFTGSHRYVLDFLVDEVFLQQSAAMQDFLLDTAVLERLTASMCNAVTVRVSRFSTSTRKLSLAEAPSLSVTVNAAV